MAGCLVTGKVANETGKVANETGKVANKTGKVANKTGKVANAKRTKLVYQLRNCEMDCPPPFGFPGLATLAIVQLSSAKHAAVRVPMVHAAF